jgi:Ankyrin repeats (3 copies)
MDQSEKVHSGHIPHLKPFDWTNYPTEPGGICSIPSGINTTQSIGNKRNIITTVLNMSQDGNRDASPSIFMTDEVTAKRARHGVSPSDGDDIRKSMQDVISTNDKRSISDMPDPNKDCNPDDFLRQLLHALYGFEPKIKKAIDLGSFFPMITDEQIAAYDILVVSATRENDVERLKSLYTDKNMSVACCNRFGESLLHMACRRGFHEIVDFLLNDAKISTRIRDDCGRTPLHDVCWNPQPQLEMAESLIRLDPTLLLISDKRGHTPFQYARPQDWPKWRKFLLDQRNLLEGLLHSESKDIFC